MSRFDKRMAHFYKRFGFQPANGGGVNGCVKQMLQLQRQFAPVPSASASVISLAIILAGGGCATKQARKHLHSVAKGWCETIPASQVNPVYPLIQDLVIGDVFLVQAPLSTQENDHQKRGFLTLDDHRFPLPFKNFTTMYFDGYCQDQFGKIPHFNQVLTNAGTWSNTMPGAFTKASAPRAAFPTYSSKAQSGFGLSATFPIHGVPVVLSYFRHDQANGSVTIVDARTYTCEKGYLLALLHQGGCL